MAKRFIDTNIFGDEFFQDLSKDGKLYFIYFITNCDHAGILKLNKKLCEFQTGIKSIDTVSKELCNCIVIVKDGVYFMPKFIKFQYPNFPQSKVRQQDSAVKILQEYDLLDEKHKIKLKSYLTVSKELTNSYDNGNDTDNGIDSGNVDEDCKGEGQEIPDDNQVAKIPPDFRFVEEYFNIKGHPEEAERFYNYYQSNGWKVGKNKMKDWKAATRTWLINKKTYQKNGTNTEITEPKFGRLPISELENFVKYGNPIQSQEDTTCE